MTQNTAPKAILGYQPTRLAQFIKKQGGIVEEGGELAARDITSSSLVGLVRSGTDANGARRDVATSRQVDYVRQEVFEAGYFPNKQDYNDITNSELFDAIAADIAGTPHYKADDAQKLEDALADDGYLDDLARQGIYEDMSIEDIQQQLIRNYDEQAAADNARAKAEMQEQANASEEHIAQIEAAYAEMVADFSDDSITEFDADGNPVQVNMRDIIEDIELEERALAAMRECSI